MSVLLPPRGLTSLALLKARFDAGEDHLGLFAPFVSDILPRFGRDGFTLADCKLAVEQEHGLTIPQDALSPILARRGLAEFVRREGGRYWLTRSPEVPNKLRDQREAVERDFGVLASALRKRLSDAKEPIGTLQDALALLVAFLVDNDVVVLLDQLERFTPLKSEALSRHHSRLVAAFILEDVIPNPALASVLEQLTRGIVLQDALLLRSTSEIEQRLNGLTVFLDTGFLLGLVGAKGEAARLAARESGSLIVAVGATLAAFDATIDEMKRILFVYERLLSTPAGKLSLHSTPLTHHFLSVDASPSDIRQLSATLALSVRGSGVVVRDFPKRTADYTLDETDLERRLSRNDGSKEDSRIRHDIDCVAAILHFRAGRTSPALERTSAIFATTSGLVVRSVAQWYREQGGQGLCPVMHLSALTNIAWLKKPAAAGKLQLHELAALCEAALQPSRQVWDAFQRHLQQLHESKEISTDEAVAVVASELASSMLADMSEDSEPDASSIGDVVERVKAQYHVDADRKIALHQAEVDQTLATKNADIAERQMKLDFLTKGIDSANTRYSRAAANVVFSLLVVVIFGSLILSLPGVFDHVPRAGRVGAVATLLMSLGVQLWFAVLGGSLLALRDRIQAWFAPHIRKLQLEPPSSSTDNLGKKQ